MSAERGNILFLLLLAVVLFAALSYAVTQSMRGGGNDASKEKVELEYARVNNLLVELTTTLQRMRMNGCEVKDFERVP